MKVERVTHADIIAYLKGQTKDALIVLRKENHGIGTLLDLIDQAKTDIQFEGKKGIQPTESLTFNKTEDLLQDLLSGSATEADKSNFLSYLFGSHEFYQRCITKLNQNVQLVSAESPEQLREISIQEDDQLIENFIPDKPPNIDISYKIPIKFWNRIKESVTAIGLRGRRWAYATATLVVLLSAYFGVRYYNTTYQLILAENLLEDNYQVYMSGTPRLTGEFTSTGISQLMSEEETENYLTEAYEYTSHALESGSDSPMMYELQMKILIIQGKFSNAKAIYNQLEETERNNAKILNDLGVLMFKEKDYISASEYFRKAINAQPIIAEVHYNLALSEEKQGNIEIALEMMEQYLLLETDEGWRNAGMNFLNKYNQR